MSYKVLIYTQWSRTVDRTEIAQNLRTVTLRNTYVRGGVAV
jgi:hypothetical protein